MRQVQYFIWGILFLVLLGPASAQTAVHPRHHAKTPRVAAGAESASAGDAAAAKPGAAGTANWATRCSSATRGAPLDCSIEQSAVLTKTGQLIVLVSIRIPAQPRSPVILVQNSARRVSPRRRAAAGGQRQCRDVCPANVRTAWLFRRRRHLGRSSTGADQRAKSEGLVPGSAAAGAEHFTAAWRFRPGLREDQIVGRFDSISSAQASATALLHLARRHSDIQGKAPYAGGADKLNSSIQSPIFEASWSSANLFVRS